MLYRSQYKSSYEGAVNVGELKGMAVIIDDDERELGTMHRLVLRLSQHEVGPGPAPHRVQPGVKYDLNYEDVCCRNHTKSYFLDMDWNPVIDLVMTRHEFSELVSELNAPLQNVYPSYTLWTLSFFVCACTCVMGTPLREAIRVLKERVSALSEVWHPRGMRIYLNDVTVFQQARIVGEVILEFYTRSLYEAAPIAVHMTGGDAPDSATLKEER